MLKEGEIRIPSGCAIAAIIDRKGNRINGSEIIKSIALMHDHRVLPGERHDQVAVGGGGVARVAVKLQMAGIGPGPAGARHARLAVRRARDKQALRARGTRRPAQQNA